MTGRGTRADTHAEARPMTAAEREAARDAERERQLVEYAHEYLRRAVQGPEDPGELFGLELQAMQACYQTLAALPAQVRRDVLDFLSKRFGGISSLEVTSGLVTKFATEVATLREEVERLRGDGVVRTRAEDGRMMRYREHTTEAPAPPPPESFITGVKRRGRRPNVIRPDHVEPNIIRSGDIP